MANTNPREALRRAIEAAGGTASLARSLGIHSQAVSQWERAPAKRVFQIERATGGKVRARELRPDMFEADK